MVGYKPNVSYLNVFGSKCYILKDSRRGTFDVKGDEGIFLSYKCLNLSTHKIIESAHVRIDEFAERVKKRARKNQKTTKDLSTSNLIHC